MQEGCNAGTCKEENTVEVDATTILFAAAVIALQALSLWFIYWIIKTLRKPKARTRGGPVFAAIKGGNVPVLATFTGLRGMPWIALATNSLNPIFRIENQQLAFRVIRQRERPCTDIIEVDVREAYGTFNLIFAFHDTRLTFVANVGTAARGAQALALLPHSVPLSARARSVLQSSAPTA